MLRIQSPRLTSYSAQYLFLEITFFIVGLYTFKKMVFIPYQDLKECIDSLNLQK